MSDPFLLIGTYTSAHAAIGIYLCSLDVGGAAKVQGVCASNDPSFIARHPHLPIAYAVNGKQYVAVSTGNSLVSSGLMTLTPELRPSSSNAVFVFSLPENN